MLALPLYILRLGENFMLLTMTGKPTWTRVEDLALGRKEVLLIQF